MSESMSRGAVMAGASSTWAIVLAAGDGTRLASLTARGSGTAIPKQFFDFGVGSSLLDRALKRACRVVAADRVLPVVSEKHRPWWERGLQRIEASNVIVQPENRGTAAGILLPLLHLHERDPEAVVVILPSDHHVGREIVMRRALEAAVSAARDACTSVVLLGIMPDAPESDYGWIVPGSNPSGGPQCVTAFVEKPERERAFRLMKQGGLWSSFIMVGHVRAFLRLFAQQLPDLLSRMRARVAVGGMEPPPVELSGVYRSLPCADFSRQVLEGCRESLCVLAVPACGWSDLGTPDRVAAWLSERAPRQTSMRRRRVHVGALSAAPA
jgi:mannose-1-phosphate guanylyltransferase